MGNTAAGALLNLQGITALRGRVLQGRFLVTYHPAAVLRNNHLQEAFVSDLKTIKEIGSGDQ
jgi:DNA polymerase